MNMPAAAPAPAEILARQRAAFLRDGAPGIAERKADLKRLRRTLIAWRPRIEAAVSADFGHRSRHETATMEIVPTVQGIDYLIRNLRRFMRPRRRHVAVTMQPGRARIEYQPLGVIAAITGFASSFALVIAGLQAVGATAEEAASGLLALCVGQAIVAIALSLRYRMPIAIAWSTPGAALLVAAFQIAIASGALAGGLLVDRVGALGAPGFALVALALGSLLTLRYGPKPAATAR